MTDYQSIFPSTTFTLDLLNAVDQFYDRPKIANLIKQSDPKDFSNDYLVSVGQFGVMLGNLFEDIDGFAAKFHAASVGVNK